VRERVSRAVAERGLDVQVEQLDNSTRTAEDAARAVGCDTRQIAKSIVFIADGEPVVCVASGAHRVDPDRVCDALDCAEARPASASEVRAATGFAVGGVPPLGHGLPVLLDQTLLSLDRVWAAAGDGHTVFCADPRELARCVDAQVAPLGETAPSTP
jgi:prolyl-tRNA editing enzyme YbaK/EbsC (Cys-tRNA(Pro) deacylase)